MIKKITLLLLIACIGFGFTITGNEKFWVQDYDGYIDSTDTITIEKLPNDTSGYSIVSYDNSYDFIVASDTLYIASTGWDTLEIEYILSNDIEIVSSAKCNVYFNDTTGIERYIIDNDNRMFYNLDNRVARLVIYAIDNCSIIVNQLNDKMEIK